MRRGEIALADALGSFDDLFPFLTMLPEHAADGRRALEIAAQTSQQQAYDAQYLALAERLGVDYWTDDGRFVRAASGAFPQVKRLGSM